MLGACHCMAHVINLFLEGMSKAASFKNIWGEGKDVVIWIKGHQTFAAKMSKITSCVFGLGLGLGGEGRGG